MSPAVEATLTVLSLFVVVAIYFAWWWASDWFAHRVSKRYPNLLSAALALAPVIGAIWLAVYVDALA